MADLAAHAIGPSRRGPLRLYSLWAALVALTAGCSSADTAEISVSVDRSACTPSCAIARFEIAVQRQSGGATCNVHRGSSSGDLLVTPALALAAGGAVTVRVAAYCADADAGAPSACCAELADCVKNYVSSNPACQRAKSICPPQGQPPGPNAQTYFNDVCQKASAQNCPRCFASAALSLATRELSLTLQQLQACADAGLAAATCAP